MENYIQPNWNAPPKVRAFVTTRGGGFSRAPFTSFNLASHVEDDLVTVEKNRAKLIKDLNLVAQPYWLTQIHSDKVICLDQLERDSYEPDKVQADASFTSRSNKVCVVLTADCLPVLIAEKDGSQVAAVHAGWKGLANGVIENTLKELYLNSGQSGRDFLIWLGPAIGPEKFEVGNDVREKFLRVSKQAELAFTAVAEQKWLADIYMLARQRLIACGIKAADIYGGDLCSVSDEKNFYSYRRDGGKTGRMASLIWMDGGR